MDYAAGLIQTKISVSAAHHTRTTVAVLFPVPEEVGSRETKERKLNPDRRDLFQPLFS
jgi:hypothetical protein